MSQPHSEIKKLDTTVVLTGGHDDYLEELLERYAAKINLLIDETAVLQANNTHLSDRVNELNRKISHNE